MKVAIFSRFPKSLDTPRGGVETATLGLVKGLNLLEFVEIHVITLEKGLEKISVESFGKITVHRLPGTKWPLFMDALFGPGRKKIYEYCRKISPDIIHYQETYGLGSGGFPFPVIFTVHGFDSRNLVTEKKWMWWVRSKIWHIAERYGLKRQKNIVSITPYVRDEIAAQTSAKIYDIENAISIEYFSLPRHEVKGRIFFAGWINPRKNLVTLIKAIRRAIDSGVNISLHVAGEASDQSYYQEVIQEIKKLSLGAEVKMLGRINQNEIRKELSEASIFVLPSKQENAPMAIAEAMAAGVVVIASNVCGMPYMIEHGKTGFLVDPLDDIGIANHITSLVSDDELRSNVAKLAFADAKERFHPESVANKTIAAYREIIGEGKL